MLQLDLQFTRSKILFKKPGLLQHLAPVFVRIGARSKILFKKPGLLQQACYNTAHLRDGEVAVLMEVGSEKLRYLCGKHGFVN
jgi:hypothetical protein